jgi:hypothetical protein
MDAMNHHENSGNNGAMNKNRGRKGTIEWRFEEKIPRLSACRFIIHITQPATDWVFSSLPLIIKAKEQHGHGPIHIEAFDFLGLAVHERKIRGIKYIPCFNIEMGL